RPVPRARAESERVNARRAVRRHPRADRAWRIQPVRRRGRRQAPAERTARRVPRRTRPGPRASAAGGTRLGGAAVARPRGVRTRTLVLDAQGLSKLAAGDPAVRSLVRAAQARDGVIVTAASTVAEVLRGGPKDAPVHQALRHVIVVAISGEIGRKAGELLG